MDRRMTAIRCRRTNVCSATPCGETGRCSAARPASKRRGGSWIRYSTATSRRQEYARGSWGPGDADRIGAGLGGWIEPSRVGGSGN